MAKNLLNRYVWIVDTLSRKPMTLAELNERFVHHESLSDGKPIPYRTFKNQRDQIEELFDINIECDPRTYKYYIENQDDLATDGFRKWMLNTLTVGNLLNESHKMRQRILLEDIPSGQKYLMEIVEAMRENKTISLIYSSYWKAPYNCEIEPYFVKLFKQRWYLIGRKVNEEKTKVFAIDRMEKIALTANSFSYPQDFDPEDYFYYNFGIIRDEKPPQHIVLRFFEQQGLYIRSLPLHASQKELNETDGYIDMEYFMVPTYDFVQFILSQGGEVEVLSPQSLRDEVVDELKRLNDIYE
ncbi:WYL domain-containing protein [Bacteroides sp. OttesenSCG-928-D19]|nr:WYL domain-containing protein [Bacteroides sp. OttesenSCG-928-D19]